MVDIVGTVCDFDVHMQSGLIYWVGFSYLALKVHRVKPDGSDSAEAIVFTALKLSRNTLSIAIAINWVTGMVWHMI